MFQCVIDRLANMFIGMVVHLFARL
jgi:hypothetical protein